MKSFEIRTGLGLFAGFFLLVLSVFASPSSVLADDSGPGIWDFLLFGNINAGGSIQGNTISGTPKPLTGNGYGLGFGTEVWFTDNIAARLLVQADAWASPSGGYGNIQNGPAFVAAPITLGPVFKLLGTTNYFLYAPLDLGYALTYTSGPPSGSSVSVLQGHSLYGDIGIGLNIRFVTIEAKIAYLATPNPYSGGTFFFPISLGFDL